MRMISDQLAAAITMRDGNCDELGPMSRELDELDRRLDASAPDVTIGLREESRNPGHCQVAVFIGRNEGARGHSGTLTLRTDEWDEIRAHAIAGVALVELHVTARADS